MTYIESAALMNDFEFRGRIKVAALKYADAIFIESEATPAHNTRQRWATATFQNPEQAAITLHSPVVMDPAVQTAGKDVDDLGLQGAVEGVINKML
jgi:hypothetical protein